MPFYRWVNSPREPVPVPVPSPSPKYPSCMNTKFLSKNDPRQSLVMTQHVSFSWYHLFITLVAFFTLIFIKLYAILQV